MINGEVIRRQDVLDLAKKGILISNGNYESVCKAINEIPSAEPKTGHWIEKEDDTCWWYVCSECEQEPLKNRWNDDDVLSTFCPNCGAKMLEPQERSDKCSKCEYYINPDYTRCKECGAERSDKE